MTISFQCFTKQTSLVEVKVYTEKKKIHMDNCFLKTHNHRVKKKK